MKRLAACAVALAVAGGGGILAVSAAGHDKGRPSGTLAVNVELPSPGSPELGANMVNEAGRTGDDVQIGDIFAGNGRVLQDGHQIGTFHFDNLVTDADPPTTIITGILALQHGTILTEGTAALGSSSPLEAAVIGGTGTYAGARGTVTVTPIPDTSRTRVVVRFIP